jgi:hypothetical protein
MRIAPLPQSDADAHWLVGSMCCTPERGGLEVRFSDSKIGLPVINDPHESRLKAKHPDVAQGCSLQPREFMHAYFIARG